MENFLVISAIPLAYWWVIYLVFPACCWHWRRL